MLRDLVQARTGGGIAAQRFSLEEVTAERDFFREKYIEQVDEMEGLKGKLKESQRVIDKLRSHILDLETEKTRLVEISGGGEAMAPKKLQSGGSSRTSLTCLTCDDDITTKSGVEENNSESVIEGSDPDVAESPCSPVGDEQSTPGQELCEEEDEEENGTDNDDDDDEADKIRANAERMLLWANYQTSKRSTPKSVDGHDDSESKSEMESCSESKSALDLNDAAPLTANCCRRLFPTAASSK